MYIYMQRERYKYIYIYIHSIAYCQTNRVLGSDCKTGSLEMFLVGGAVATWHAQGANNQYSILIVHCACLTPLPSKVGLTSLGRAWPGG